MVNSKDKGRVYEYKIRDLLKKELKIDFERTPHSGSLKFAKGDLWVPTDTASWKYAIEIKHYGELEFKNLLVSKSNDIHSFWEQTIKQAEAMKKFPLLIFKWDRSANYVGWNDNIQVDKFMHVKAFNSNFKIGLLDEWLVAYKKTNLL